MQIMAPADDRDPTWLAFRLATWPEISKVEHLAAMEVAFLNGLYVRLAISCEGFALGFIEASKRTQSANVPPITFIDGLYIALRTGSAKIDRTEILRRLVAALGLGSSRETCNELAFDSQLPLDAAHLLQRTFSFRVDDSGTYLRHASAPTIAGS